MSLFPVFFDKAQLTNDAPALTDNYVNGVLIDSANTYCRAATAGGAQRSNGFLMSNAGQVIYVDATAGLPAGVQYCNGLPFAPTGELCVSTDVGVTYSNGLPFAANGALSVLFGFAPSALFAGGEQGVWYDPNDLSTLFQDSAGTIPVTAAGQPVGLMLDKSGRGNSASQATGAKRPTLQVDEYGLNYLAFDGTNDSMSTGAIDLSATDKITGWAGFRKESDSTTAALFEFSPDTNANSGVFAVFAPSVAGMSNVGYRNKGTTMATAVANGLASPIAIVTSIIGDIANDVSTIRANGLPTNNGGDLGTGNYGIYSLFIGMRNNATIQFTGRLYSLIIRGAQSSAQQIEATENWVNQRTHAY